MCFFARTTRRGAKPGIPPLNFAPGSSATRILTNHCCNSRRISCLHNQTPTIGSAQRGCRKRGPPLDPKASFFVAQRDRHKSPTGIPQREFLTCSGIRGRSMLAPLNSCRSAFRADATGVARQVVAALRTLALFTRPQFIIFSSFVSDPTAKEAHDKGDYASTENAKEIL